MKHHPFMGLVSFITLLSGLAVWPAAARTVPGAPAIAIQPVSQTVTNGVSVTFGLTATGTNLSYQWYYNGLPLVGSNVITTVAGNQSIGNQYSGDGGPATNAGLNYPSSMAFDAAGDMYIADLFNNVVRKVDPQGVITTVAGNNSLGGQYSGDGGPATAAALYQPGCIALDRWGNLYITDTGNNVIRRVDTNGIITTVAGNISLGGQYSGDGGAATNAAFNRPSGIVVDNAGNIYMGDSFNNVVRKIDPAGIITTVAGNYSLGAGYAGDGGPATNADLNVPNQLCLDARGNLYICDCNNGVIRRVDTNGIITTVAGNQSLAGSYTPDGTQATNAAFNSPEMVVVDGAGQLYIADFGNNVVRKVGANGIITTVAGNYGLGAGYSGDGGSPTNATLNNPDGLALDASGNLYIGDAHNNVIRKVSSGMNVGATGALTLDNVQTTTSGKYQVVITNSQGSVTSVAVNLVVYGPPMILDQPVSQLVGAGKSVTFSVSATGTPTVKYQWRFNGTNLAGATSSNLTLNHVQAGQAGNYTVTVITPAGDITSDSAVLTVIALPVIASQPTNHITATNGVTLTIGAVATGPELSYEWLYNGAPISGGGSTISTYAGNQSLGSYSGDGGPAINAGMQYPNSLVWDSAGDLYICDTFDYVVRKVDASGTITTVAGNNGLAGGFSGDGGPATNAALNIPNGITLDSGGNLYIADTYNNVVRRVDTQGTITTVAGNYSLGAGFSGDGGPATNATMNQPTGVILDQAGNLYISELGNSVLRKVDTNGIITTVAGNYSLGAGYSGDGGAATNAQLNGPYEMAFDQWGNLYITDCRNSVIRRIDTNGIIATVAGNASLGGGYSVDGTQAINAALNLPNGVVPDNQGGFYVVEYGNNIVRKVDANGILSTVAGNYNLGAGYSGDGGPATNAALNNPVGLVSDGAGNLYIADAHNNVVRKVSLGFPVNGTNGTLTIPDAQGGQSGNYQLVVSNPGGSVTSSIVKVTIDAPLLITAEPGGTNAIEGGSVYVPVGVTGTAPLKYQWSLNGVKVSGATNAVLAIVNIHPSQAGNYSVKVTSANNLTAVSSNALITVTPVYLMVYSYSGTESYHQGTNSVSYNYDGMLYYQPFASNGTYLTWAVVSGKRQFWTGPFGNYPSYVLTDSGGRSFTVWAQANQNNYFYGGAYLSSAIYKGQNSLLNIGGGQKVLLPAVINGAVTDVYPSPDGSETFGDESSSTYVLQTQTTQQANNHGQTQADLFNPLMNTLVSQGYRSFFATGPIPVLQPPVVFNPVPISISPVVISPVVFPPPSGSTITVLGAVPPAVLLPTNIVLTGWQTPLGTQFPSQPVQWVPPVTPIGVTIGN